MTTALILASGSEIRARLLTAARIPFRSVPAWIDETAIIASLRKTRSSAGTIADALAQAKAVHVSATHRDDLVLGCDQILEFHGQILRKPQSKSEAIDQLSALAGNQHRLFTAAVLASSGQPFWRTLGCVTVKMRQLSAVYLRDYVDRSALPGTASLHCLASSGQPFWRTLGCVTVKMRQLSAVYLRDYVDRNWDSIRHSVGCYKIEEEGIRLMSKIDGDYFHILGLPLIELTDQLIALRFPAP